MRIRSLHLFAATAALALALPAVTASAADTDVTVEVTGTSGLSIAVAPGSTTLTEADGVAAGALPRTTVTDARGGLSGLTWNVTVSGTNLTHTSLEAEISRAQAHVHLPLTGVDSFTRMEALAWELPAGLKRLDASYSLVNGTSALGLLGTGSIAYTPRMSVAVPDGQLGGTYTGKVTQTVSAS